MFKNHLDMIGRNEPVSKKAKFWQSYVRSLKGSDDIRAPEYTYRPRYGGYRPLSSALSDYTWPLGKSMYDTPGSHALERIGMPGYRYLPIHRETYGYSPRDIYAHHYSPLDRYRPIYHVSPRRYGYGDPFDSSKAWQDHLDRMADLDRRYPSRYGLIIKDRPLAPLPHVPPKPIRDLTGVEYEPDNKPHFNYAEPKEFGDFGTPGLPLDQRSLRHMSPTPIKIGEFAPRENEIAFNDHGSPIWSLGGLKRRPWHDLLNPSWALPSSAITRDPWWWSYPELRPFAPYVPRWGTAPFFLRDSYLSPVKRTYLWNKHPVRPLDETISAYDFL